jgi:N-acetylmuramoyl-L-alanine amidase
LLVLAVSSAFGADSPRDVAAERHRYARLLLEDLNSVATVELGEEQYLLVIDAFQKVHRTSPASSFCDDALLQAAHLYREMVRRFGAARYREKSITAYQFLIREYPHSKLIGAARQAIDGLEKGVPAPDLRQVSAAIPDSDSDSDSDAGKDLAVSKDSAAIEDPAAGKPEVEVAEVAAEVASEVAAVVAPVVAPVVATVEEPVLSDPAAGAGTAEQISRAGQGGEAGVVAILSSRSMVLPVADKPKAGERRGTLTRVEGVRFWSHPDCTRVVIELDGRVEISYDQLRAPKRLFFDLMESRLGDQLTQESSFEVGDSFLQRLRVAQFARRSTRVVFDLQRAVYFDVAWLSNPPRLVVEVRDRDEPALLSSSAPAPAPPTPARPTSPAPLESRQARVEEASGLAGKTAPEPLASPAAKPGESFARALDRSGESPASSGAPAQSTKSDAAAETPVRVVPKTSKATTPAVAKTNAPAAAETKAAKAAETLAAKTPETPAPATAERTAPKAAETAPVEMAKLAPPPAPAPELAAPKPATPNAKGQRSLIRALGLKVGRVVIDAGHGGHDPGTIGPSGLQEKDLVLDVALRLGKLIEEGLGSEIVYTRDDDRFLSHKERTRLANTKQADLFISIHANSSPSRKVRGIETYYLNFTTDSWALTVASRENAASDRSVHELQDLLSKIALKEKIEESQEFASRIQEALHSGLSDDTSGLRNRGVRKAPFLVLIGAKMPAVLAEIGFISNPQTEKLLKTSAYRQQVANHLYQGILSYAESLGNITMARTEDGEPVVE